MDGLLESLLNNEFYKTIWKNEKIIIKTISILQIEKTLDSYVERFINSKTFPYVNSLYNRLLANCLDELPSTNKIEIGGIIEKYLNEIDTKHKQFFDSLDNEQLIKKYGFDEEEIATTSRNDLFKSIKGGYYCEMLLSCIFISLGFEKIISKLYFQFGTLSPTGIDVPFVNIDKKVLILGECKLYKNILSAIKSCINDLEDILKEDKLNKEFLEWKSKYTSINENFRRFLDEYSIDSVEKMLTLFNSIIVLGFVVGDKINEERLKERLEASDCSGIKEKFNILLITIPIESKDTFTEKCYNALIKIKKEL